MSASERTCTFFQAQPLEQIDSGRDHGHSHDHGHTHEHMDTPGNYLRRELPKPRLDFKKRAFTVGIGGPVGSGKTALVLALTKLLREKYSVCVVTNDIFTKEDWEFLVRNEALPVDRMRAVETGGCPHAAIREDYSTNLMVIKELTKMHNPNIVILESGGDNLAANFSRDLADYIIYVIDVADAMICSDFPFNCVSECMLVEHSFGHTDLIWSVRLMCTTVICNTGGDKIPRKGGPGITESDLLIINKTDLAEAVGADLKVMERDSFLMRQEGPTLFIQAKHMVGVDTVADLILQAYKETVF